MTVRWTDLTPREQMVWAAAYAIHGDAPADACRKADRIVSGLRELNIENVAPIGPEHEAAKFLPGLSFKEFRAWYPVALKIARKGQVSPQDVDEAACEEAYGIYRQCTSDFY